MLDPIAHPDFPNAALGFIPQESDLDCFLIADDSFKNLVAQTVVPASTQRDKKEEREQEVFSALLVWSLT